MVARDDKKKKLTIEDIEAMTPHDLADLLSLVVLALRRMPHDVCLVDLSVVGSPVQESQLDGNPLVAAFRHEPLQQDMLPDALPGWAKGSL